jgi:hypothetical protein
VRAVRWTGATVLLLLAALLVVSAVAARYVRGQVLDTDRYVETVTPLATDPDIQAAVSNRLTDEVVDRIDIPALARELATTLNPDAPPRPVINGLLAGPVTDAVDSFVAKQVDKFVHSGQFVTLWTEANRVAHQELEIVLTGEGGRLASTQGTDIVIDLGPLLATVKQNLVDRGFSVASNIPDVSIPFTVMSSDKLPEIQRYVRWLDTAATWLPLVALLLFAVGVLTAPNRRRGLFVGFVLTGVLTAVVLIAERVVGNQLSDRAALRGASVPAVQDAYDILTRFLVAALWTVFVVCVLGALWMYLCGPGRAPTAGRRVVNRGFDAAATPLRDGPAATVARPVARWRAWVAAVAVLLGLWWLLSSPSVGTALWIALCALLLAGLLGFAGRIASGPPAPAPAAPDPDDPRPPPADGSDAAGVPVGPDGARSGNGAAPTRTG